MRRNFTALDHQALVISCPPFQKHTPCETEQKVVSHLQKLQMAIFQQANNTVQAKHTTSLFEDYTSCLWLCKSTLRLPCRDWCRRQHLRCQTEWRSIRPSVHRTRVPIRLAPLNWHSEGKVCGHASTKMLAATASEKKIAEKHQNGRTHLVFVGISRLNNCAFQLFVSKNFKGNRSCFERNNSNRYWLSCFPVKRHLKFHGISNFHVVHICTVFAEVEEKSRLSFGTLYEAVRSLQKTPTDWLHCVKTETWCCTELIGRVEKHPDGRWDLPRSFQWCQSPWCCDWHGLMVQVAIHPQLLWLGQEYAERQGLLDQLQLAGNSAENIQKSTFGRNVTLSSAKTNRQKFRNYKFSMKRQSLNEIQITFHWGLAMFVWSLDVLYSCVWFEFGFRSPRTKGCGCWEFSELSSLEFLRNFVKKMQNV